MRICTRDEIRQLDEKSMTQFSIRPELLMEIAGARATEIFLKYRPNAGFKTPVILITGMGNNGGDAMVIARHLVGLGRKSHVFLIGSADLLRTPNTDHWKTLKQLGVPATEVSHIQTLSSFFEQNPGPHDVIDGLLGTGMQGSTSGVYYDVIEAAQKHAGFVFALDLPSGVDANTGQVAGRAFRADITASFGFPKLGHFFAPGAELRGKLVNLSLSYPPQLTSSSAIRLLRDSEVAKLLTQRDRYGHKNSFGHTLVIGGSLGKVGAISLSAKACHKMGTGLVTAATWLEVWPTLMSRVSDETMTFGLEDIEKSSDRAHELLSPFSSVVLGPGLGTDARAKKLLEAILETYRGPIILDADALNLVAQHGYLSRLKELKVPCIMTPHPGEMSRLLKIDKQEIVERPLEAIQQAMDLTHATVVLKGAVTLVGSVGSPMYLNHYPNDGMATAGTGDVLAGMLGGLVGQGMAPASAALLGVYLHSLAGDLAAQTKGHRSMTAGDIIGNIGNAFQTLKETKTQKENPIFTRIR